MLARTVTAGLIALTALAGCGEDAGPDFTLRTPPPYVGAYPVAPSGQETVDRKITRTDVEKLRPVLAAWSEAVLRRDAAEAATFFGLPAIVYQPGSGPLEVRTPQIAEAFNAALPCGAKLVGANADGRYLVGTFVLVQTAGKPCPGKGELARVGFVFGDRNHPRQFTEWWQVADSKSSVTGPPARPKGTTPATTSDFG